MDNAILKKRLNTFKSAKGTLRQVSDEVIMEVLRAWESWPGQSKEFYQNIGLSKQQLAILIGKGKRLVKSGTFADGGEFKEIKVIAPSNANCQNPIVLKWEKGKVIKFSQVDQLVDFLKKVA
jgi:hypothetical protein